MSLTTLDIERISDLRYGDGLTCRETAALVGCDRRVVSLYAPGLLGKVPNDKLREAFVASRLSAGEVARRMGWMSTAQTRGPCGDGSRVKRTLGFLSDANGRGHRSVRSLIDAETAGLMAEALGLMAWEVMPDDERAAA